MAGSSIVRHYAEKPKFSVFADPLYNYPDSLAARDLVHQTIPNSAFPLPLFLDPDFPDLLDMRGVLDDGRGMLQTFQLQVLLIDAAGPMVRLVDQMIETLRGKVHGISEDVAFD